MNAFAIERAHCRIESVTFSKSKPKSANDDGAGVKKLKLWFDVADEGWLTAVTHLFAGVIDENTLKRVASEEGPGFELRSKRKLGVSVVKVFNPEGEVLFESSIARVERPKLVIGKEAKTAWLVLDVEMSIPKKALSLVDDYFRADIVASVAVAQLDIEDEAKTVVRRKRAKAEPVIQADA